VGGIVITCCVLLAGLGSTLALPRAGLGVLDVSLAAAISADYSADLLGRTKLAPLSDEIIDEARGDEGDLVRAIDGNDPSGGTDPGSPTASPTPTPPGTFTTTPTPARTTTPTARPSGTGTSGPTPSAGPTATPTQTPTPTPLLTPGPTPTLVPALPRTLYLHNDPTPPIGDTVSHSSLRMDTVTPTGVCGVFLACPFNYDTDRDAGPGLSIQRGGSGVDENDAAQQQVWRTPVAATTTRIVGSVTFEVWSASKNFQVGQSGSISVYLRDFDGSGYKEIAVGKLTQSDWQGTNLGWVKRTITLEAGSYTVPAGHRLELKLIVNGASSDDLWFAYDTIVHPARVRINQ